MTPTKPEIIDHPQHYNMGKIEIIDFIEDQQLGFHEGNTIKYICRAKHKGAEVDDLKKARWYLDRLISKKERIIKQAISNISNRLSEHPDMLNDLQNEHSDKDKQMQITFKSTID